MLFHSHEFLLVFLPITLLAYYSAGRVSLAVAFGSLALASLIFYGWWNPKYVLLIAASIIFNYFGALFLERLRALNVDTFSRIAFWLLISANLALLAYFKYLVFFSEQLSRILGTNWQITQILLPIGISFYTFTQIAYLADVLAGRVKERSFLSYVLFVTYFPHLIAGPVLHHAEMMPQFSQRRALSFSADNFALGLTLFSFGLIKKVVLADGCAPVANSVFDSVTPALAFADAWLGAVAYALQIYFDFSGYSDMAIGLSLLFNIRLPINFNSPYRARNIIEFWRCWHMTLSRFLRDYLYIPLGGNRHGASRRYTNLMITMVLGGLWHGANWTFVIWGTLHGAYLIINNLWRIAANRWEPLKFEGRLANAASWGITFMSVTIAWVFFRAHSVKDATTVLSAMANVPAFSSTPSSIVTLSNVAFIAGLLLLARFAPNTNQLFRYNFSAESEIALNTRWRWYFSIPSAVLLGAMLFVCLFVGMTSRTKLEFLYFQF